MVSQKLLEKEKYEKNRAGYTKKYTIYSHHVRLIKKFIPNEYEVIDTPIAPTGEYFLEIRKKGSEGKKSSFSKKEQDKIKKIAKELLDE